MSKPQIKPMNYSLLNVYKKIWENIPIYRRLHLIALIFLMLLTSFFEVVSIGAVIPFIGILISPDKLNGIDFLTQNVPINWQALDISTKQLYITIMFALAVSFAGLLRIFLMLFQTWISHSLGVEFGVKVFSSIIFLDYQEHTSSNRSELITAVAKAQELIPYLLQPSLMIVSSSMITLSIFFTLLYVDYFVTLVTAISFVTIYFMLIKIFKKTLIQNSDKSARERVKSLKIISEGLGGIRDIILDRSYNYFIRIFRKSSFEIQSANAHMQIVATIPRFVLETFGIVIIAILAFIMVNNGENMMDIIPIFGVLALGAQRLLPMLQQIYSAFTSILGNKSSIAEAVQRFDIVSNNSLNNSFKKNPKNISFIHSIELKNISFRFSKSTPLILDKLSLNIKKGSRIGIIGKTGCGKSTALDILMSLLNPQEGSVLLDGVPISKKNAQAWQAMISHVPQNIFYQMHLLKRILPLG